MAKKKEPLGFKTPSMQIQEEYKEILEQIKAKEADWEKILKVFEKVNKFAFDSSRDTLKKSEAISETPKDVALAVMTKIEYGGLLWLLSVALTLIARVGKELAECDVKISKVEKELKDLRGALK